MEPSNTRERQNELWFNDDQLSESELDFEDFSDETHVPQKIYISKKMTKTFLKEFAYICGRCVHV